MLIRADADGGLTVLDALRKHRVYIPAVCGGKGTCGKCAVRIKAAGKPPATVLACETYVTEDIEATPVSDDAGFEILTGYAGGADDFEPRFTLSEFNRTEIGRSLSESLDIRLGGVETPLGLIKKLSGMINPSGGVTAEKFYILADGRRAVGALRKKNAAAYGIAIDIGTTTVCMQLVDLLDGAERANCSLINRQRKFGADVISRIQNSEGDNFFELTRLIRDDIRAGVGELLKKRGLSYSDVYQAAVSGNTTMIQFFLGIPCVSHGHSPFTATFTGLREFGCREIFGDGFLTCNITVMPGISAFVGSDIVSGLLLCQKEDDSLLFIDIGTNGEMALVANGRVVCTSTAAGPAFEGGNISCGTGSVPGAIASIRYENGKFIFKTIAGAPPSGLCGTGAIDLVAEMLDNGMMDETGSLDDSAADGVKVTDGVVFTQKDVREMQLAKSALRSGIECLINSSGTSYAEIGRVIIAGGFGFKLNLDSAVRIGMIPEELKAKVSVAGNSSLGGCVKALVQSGAASRAVAIANGCEEINLSEDRLFNRLFTEFMYF